MKKPMCICVAMLTASVLTAPAGPARADVVSLTPSKDNTLYDNPDGDVSNGVGSYLFGGLTDEGSNDRRRVVMAFDVSGSIPAGSTIDSVTLTLEMSRSKVNNMTFDLHRLTSDWGEGVSNADGQEGAGAPSQPNDATWIHTFYDESDTNLWTTPGGDFNPTASASTVVGKNVGAYTWGSSSQMISDVQGWLDNPSTNFGWLLKGPEGLRSAKRFNSRENSDASTWPTLTVTFTSGGPSIFNWVGTGGGGSFHDDANWDAGAAPSSATDIVNLVNTDTEDQVATLANSVTVDDLTVNGLTNTMTLGIGQGLTINVNTLEVGELGGLDMEMAVGNAAQVNVSGSVSLAGHLSLRTAGPTPAANDTFTFLSFASRTGRFGEITDHEIVPGQDFSVHYNDTRALAIAGEWAATGLDVTGDVDVPVGLILSGEWQWNGMLVKWGQGDLTIDLTGGFTAGTSAALAIVDGRVLLQGAGQTLNLDELAYGDLGVLSGEPALQGVYGWFGSPFAIPEPSTLILMITGVWMLRRRSPQ